MFSLRDKVAVLTGGAGGIGRATALAFARGGATLVIADVDEAGAEATAVEATSQGVKAVARPVDVARGDSILALVESAVQAFGRLDIVMHAAGVLCPGTVLEVSEADWDLSMTVNLKSLYWIARHAQPHLARTSGCIVTVASLAGLKGTRGTAAYNASKSGVVVLTKCLALDFAPYGIRVNCVCPAIVETRMGEAAIALRAAAGTPRDAVRGQYPLGRFGRPDDVAHAAFYLASDAASWMTGTALVVDGGAGAGG